MRHGISGYKLGRNHGQRKALFKTLARSVLLYETVKTTLPKAKAVRSFVEKLITVGKKGSLSARRQLLAFFPEDSNRNVTCCRVSTPKILILTFFLAKLNNQKKWVEELQNSC